MACDMGGSVACVVALDIQGRIQEFRKGGGGGGAQEGGGCGRGMCPLPREARKL